MQLSAAPAPHPTPLRDDVFAVLVKRLTLEHAGSLIVGVKMTGNQFVPAGETTFQVIPWQTDEKWKKYDKNLSFWAYWVKTYT